MSKLKVDYDGAEPDDITVFASPETLRAIADLVETNGGAYAEGEAVDLAVPARILFSPEWEGEG